jgi:hypothetical protein
MEVKRLEDSVGKTFSLAQAPPKGGSSCLFALAQKEKLSGCLTVGSSHPRLEFALPSILGLPVVGSRGSAFFCCSPWTLLGCTSEKSLPLFLLGF